MVKKILLADVCLSNKLIRLLRQKDITVIPVKNITESSSVYDYKHGIHNVDDDKILEFVKKKDWILITADKRFARRYSYGILVSANCKKEPDEQLEEALVQYEIIKNGKKLRHMTDSNYKTRDTKPKFIEAFGEVFI
jgi:F0F1-type ATP synthase gamma subunit